MKKPVQIIQEAQEKMRKNLMAECADRIDKICKEFTDETGVKTGIVSFEVIDVSNTQESRCIVTDVDVHMYGPF